MSCTGLSRTQLRIHGSTPLYTPPSEVGMGRPCAVTLDPLVRQPKSNPRRTPGPRHPAVPVRTKSLPPRHSCPRVYHPARSVTRTSVSADGIHGARDNLGCTAMRHAQIMEIVERYIEHRDANLSPPAPLPLPGAILRNFAVEDFFPFFPSLDDSVAPPGPSPTPPTTRSETSVVPPVAQLLGPQGRRWSRHGSFKARSSRSTIGPTSHELFNAQGSTRNHRIEPDFSETQVMIFIAILCPSHESRSTTSRPPSARAVAASAICGNRDSREVGDENEQGEHGQSTPPPWWPSVTIYFCVWSVTSFP